MDRSGASRRTLVVEDCRDTADTLRILLDLWGHDVRVAHDGQAALVLAATFQPEVVLLNIRLPGLDGFEVARQLKDLPLSRFPLLIAATGFDGADVRHQARRAGFDHFLAKPLDLLRLRSLLTQGTKSVAP